MKFVMNHAPDAGSIARPGDQQTSALRLTTGVPCNSMKLMGFILQRLEMYFYVYVLLCTIMYILCTSMYMYYYVYVPLCICTIMYMYYYVYVLLCIRTIMYMYYYV